MCHSFVLQLTTLVTRRLLARRCGPASLESINVTTA